MDGQRRPPEIADQATYLDALLGHLLLSCPSDVHITVLGFSQGITTISSWLVANAGRWRPNRLVLWASGFPVDIEAEAAQQLLHDLPLVLVSEELDGYASPDKL